MSIQRLAVSDQGAIVIEDRVDMQCIRHVHLISNLELGEDVMRSYGIVCGGVATREAGVWHLREVHPYRGAIDIPAACKEGKVRRLVAWSLTGMASVKVALHEAAREFERLFGGRAEFGFMKKLPKVAEHGAEVGDLILLEAEWMLERCVAVGCKTPLSTPLSPSTMTSPPLLPLGINGGRE